MNPFKVMIFCGAFALGSSEAHAIHVGSYNGKDPDRVIQTQRGLYDLERCIIEIDGPSVPSAYRQPDRPGEVLIAWVGGDFGGVTVIKLDGIENARLRFWGRDKIMRRVQEGCLQ